MRTQDYIFNYSISTRPYNRNTDASKTYALQWSEKRGTVNGFLQDIKNGYAYCPTFYHEGDTFSNGDKTQNNLKATYFITFDFDAVRLTAGEFYGCMIGTEITPAMVYTTANDGNFKAGKNETYCNRYRVIYLIDEPITTAETYTAIHTALKGEIAATVNDNNIYNDGTDSGQAERFYFGNVNAEIYADMMDDVITPLAWLLDRYNIAHDGTEINANNGYNDEASAYRYGDMEKCQKVGLGEYIERECNIHPSPQNGTFSNAGIWEAFTADYSKKGTTFYSLYQMYRGHLQPLPTAEEITPYLEASDPHKLYIEVPANFKEIRHKKVKTQKMINGEMRDVWTNYKYKDGELRHAKIFNYLMRLRTITPSATKGQLLWAAVVYMVEHIDNSKEAKTKRQIMRIVEDVASKDIAKYGRLWEGQNRAFKVNREEAASRNISVRRAGLEAQHERATDKKKKKYQIIAAHYDPSRSDKDNLEILSNAGLSVTADYLKTWKKDNGLTKQGKASRGEKIAEIYNPSRTDKDNLAALKDAGVNISMRTLKRWKSANGYTKQRAKNTQEPNRAVEGVINAVVEDLPTEQDKQQQGANGDYFPSLDVEDLASEFLSGGTVKHESGKPSKTCKEFDPWDFYKSHDPEGVKYGRDVIKAREQAARHWQETETSGIDYNSMTDDEFWQMLFDESKQEVCTAATPDVEIEDEPF